MAPSNGLPSSGKTWANSFRQPTPTSESCASSCCQGAKASPSSGEQLIGTSNLQSEISTEPKSPPGALKTPWPASAEFLFGGEAWFKIVLIHYLSRCFNPHACSRPSQSSSKSLASWVNGCPASATVLLGLVPWAPNFKSRGRALASNLCEISASLLGTIKTPSLGREIGTGVLTNGPKILIVGNHTCTSTIRPLLANAGGAFSGVSSPSSGRPGGHLE